MFVCVCGYMCVFCLIIVGETQGDREETVSFNVALFTI